MGTALMVRYDNTASNDITDNDILEFLRQKLVEVEFTNEQGGAFGFSSSSSSSGNVLKLNSRQSIITPVMASALIATIVAAGFFVHRSRRGQNMNGNHDMITSKSNVQYGHLNDQSIDKDFTPNFPVPSIDDVVENGVNVNGFDVNVDQDFTPNFPVPTIDNAVKDGDDVDADVNASGCRPYVSPPDWISQSWESTESMSHQNNSLDQSGTIWNTALSCDAFPPHCS